MRARSVCFVTGTRAEFGLMQSALRAIASHPKLHLQVIATGSHTDPTRGRTIDHIVQAGFRVDRVIPWRGRGTASSTAAATGELLASLARAYRSLKSEMILVTGDRVEAFAAAAAAHIAGLPVAHVHGGDRAMGQVDDSLRHAITKLSHVHLAATKQSARRIARLGEQAWRIRVVGAPGIDGIRQQAAPAGVLREMYPNLRRRRFAMLVLHPIDPSARIEGARAKDVLHAIRNAGIERVLIVQPNNDPGAAGIVNAWQRYSDPAALVVANLRRDVFLGLLRDCAVLVGNSSAGIIEAGSFGTPVVDIGPRQKGREHGLNVTHVPYSPAAVERAVGRIWRGGNPARFPARNVYGGVGAGRRIAQTLASVQIDRRLLRKLITY